MGNRGVRVPERSRTSSVRVLPCVCTHERVHVCDLQHPSVYRVRTVTPRIWTVYVDSISASMPHVHAFNPCACVYTMYA